MGTKTPLFTNMPVDADSGFAGTLKNIQLNDLIQMCCLSASSLCMRVNKGGRQGTIFIIDGEIVHADCGEITGEEAFYQILGWQTGSFESFEVSDHPPRSIKQNYQFLIMEAARRVDEKEPEAPSKPAERATGARIENTDGKTRVLIVDDSPMMRKIISGMLTSSNRLEVVGMAGNGREAIQLIEELSPDLVMLDINMPVMDGSSTIKHIMIRKPCPVVIMSNPGDGSARVIFNFLELGAIDFIGKPKRNQDILIQQKKMVKRLSIAATAKVDNFRMFRLTQPASPPMVSGQGADATCQWLAVVVTGPGGHPDQMRLLPELVPALAGVGGAVVATQGLPPLFDEPLAQYFTQRCGFPAACIHSETVLRIGNCYVGGQAGPIAVKRIDDQMVIDSTAPAGADGGMPVDCLLVSAAKCFGNRLVVILLSGADSGSHVGLEAVRNAGGRVILTARTSAMVAGPLDQVADAGLADTEVDPADLVTTVLNGFAH
ncbi:hypothetical protein DSCO28_04430 [Desulfosarcina ovata subsp. sediminis]|uniref:protein-glutamate methylesterase n=1 Tax=Desulfosarcina ovata subsp. sediminis TaxID=885957 RepID=A0A5K7ZIU1_9BACT|nr:response regulator [Desulfosarcina ovata]BBO79877.1 hypothetical protein DSCO28_04430 [Desulfosarcina ovata subsp. sediminis]